MFTVRNWKNIYLLLFDISHWHVEASFRKSTIKHDLWENSKLDKIQHHPVAFVGVAPAPRLAPVVVAELIEMNND